MKRSKDPMRSRAAVENRLSLARLPAWTQPFWTWLSAIALPTRSRHWSWRPWQHVALTIAIVLVAAAIGTISAQILFATAMHSI